MAKFSQYKVRRTLMANIDVILKVVCGSHRLVDKRTITLVGSKDRKTTYTIRRRDSNKLYTFTVDREGNLVNHDGKVDSTSAEPCVRKTHTRFKFTSDVRSFIRQQLGDDRSYDLRSLRVIETSAQGVLYSIRPRWATYDPNKFRKYFFVAKKDRSV